MKNTHRTLTPKEAYGEHCAFTNSESFADWLTNQNATIHIPIVRSDGAYRARHKGAMFALIIKEGIVDGQCMLTGGVDCPQGWGDVSAWDHIDAEPIEMTGCWAKGENEVVLDDSQDGVGV